MELGNVDWIHLAPKGFHRLPHTDRARVCVCVCVCVCILADWYGAMNIRHLSLLHSHTFSSTGQDTGKSVLR